MDKITSKHFMFFIICLTMLSIKLYPGLVIEWGGRDAWLYTLIAGLILITVGYIIINTFVKYNIPDLNFLYIKSFGKSFGTIFLLLFSAVLFLNCCESITALSSAIHTNLFIETPLFFSYLFLIIPCIYMASKGFDSIFKLALVSITFMLICTFLLIILGLPYNKYLNVTPILENKLNLNSFFSILYALGLMSTLGISLPYIKNISKKNNLKSHYFIAIIIALIIIVYSVFNIICSLGPIRANNLFYPEFIQAQRISYGGYVESGELFVLMQYMLGFIIKYLLCIYGIFYINESKLTNKFKFFTIISIFIFLFCFYFSKNTYNFIVELNYLSLANLVVILIIPLIACMLFKFSHKAN
ncbi:endospore germination permease [Clostridium sp. 'White wine YQ']|uniref:endospore germination permease n=1 Tax=Clostridium sp. 'White wine YQ' TaxID=3027474 RepID=UPI0023653C8C|nr:endospore germination permease [Clostridium sp. 'White wine YQ']MDD7794966.1 endospore germination permease [Clostridium sp. 'White wine YQ']